MPPEWLKIGRSGHGHVGHPDAPPLHRSTRAPGCPFDDWDQQRQGTVVEHSEVQTGPPQTTFGAELAAVMGRLPFGWVLWAACALQPKPEPGHTLYVLLGYYQFICYLSTKWAFLCVCGGDYFTNIFYRS